MKSPMFRLVSRSTALPLALLLASVACADDEPPADLTPPRVIRVDPTGPIIDVNPVFTVTFSEAMSTNRFDEERDFVVLVPLNTITDAWDSDIENVPLLESRQDDVVPGTLEVLEDGTQLRFTPDGVLARGTDYVLWVSADTRDVAGNPLVGAEGAKANFRLDLRTDAGPPQVLGTNAIVAGKVPPNRKRFTVEFNQPVTNVQRETLRVLSESGGAAPDVDYIEVAADRRSAVLVLTDPGSGCARMDAETRYAFVVGPGIEDDAGRVMGEERFEFETGAACDSSPNVVRDAGVAYLARFNSNGTTEVSVRYFFESSKPSTSEVRFGKSGGPLDCLGGPCPVRGPDARLVDDTGLYVHEVDVGNLAFDGNNGASDIVFEIDQAYDYVLFAEDDVGSVGIDGGVFLLQRTPTVAINELMPNPSVDESIGEFIELVNYGDGDVGLDGFGIIVADKSSCVFGPGAPTIAPGDFVIIAKTSFEPASYPGLDAAKVYNPADDGDCTDGLLTLTNDIQAVQLQSSTGTTISAYAGYANIRPTDSNEGESIERISPAAPDEAASFCFGAGAPSPGATNSSLSLGCAE